MLVTVGTMPTRIAYVNKGDTVFNTGSTIAYVDTTIANILAAPSSGAFPLYPNTSVAWDGESGMLWAADPTGGNPTVGVTPEGSGSTAAPTPGQITSALISSQLATTIANAIQAAGVPPIDHPVLLGVQFNSPVNAGATVNLSGHISVGQYQSFHAKLQAAPAVAGTTNPYIGVTFHWSMVSDGYDPTAIEDWTYQSGPTGANPYSVLGHGPVYGDTLDLLFTNYDTVQQNITWAVFGSYRTRSRSNFRGGAASGGTDALGLGTDDIIVSANGGALGAIATGPPFSMQLFDGPATVSASVVFSAAPGNSNWAIAIRPEPNNVLNNPMYVPGQDIPQLGGATPTRIVPPTLVMLPRRVCVANLINDTNVAINSYQIIVTAQEQPG